MHISVNTHTCTGGGWNSSVSLVGEFLRANQGDLGDAIAHVDIYVCFDEPPTGDVFQTPFDELIRTLPFCRFSRGKKRVELQFLTQMGDTRLIRDHPPVQLDLFVAAAKEIAAMIAQLKPKMKKSDALAYEAFQAFVAERMQTLPTSEGAFAQLQRDLQAYQRANPPPVDEEESRDELWVMIKTDDFFRAEIHQQIADELSALMKKGKLGVNDGQSSGAHQFDVNFERVKDFAKAKAAVIAFLQTKYPRIEFVVSDRYESTFDVRP